MPPDPKRAAAPTGRAMEATNESAGRLIGTKDTNAVNYAAAIDCPLACSSARRSCPWECPIVHEVAR